MEIRDPIHGSIEIDPELTPIIENPFFQRLRSIKQLGFSDYVFPGATHTRYLHSLGVMNTVSRVFNKLFPGEQSREIRRLYYTVKLAALLHDIGHAPLSHSTESVMPMVSELKLKKKFLNTRDEGRQANHEDYTIKTITESSLTPSFETVIKKFGVSVDAIAELVIGSTTESDYFTIGGVNYFPMLHQMVSSELDCDRMDYLLRDSYFCGVSYGKYDLDWMIDNFLVAKIDNFAYLGIKEKALTSFDDFLLSRFHMFLMVYFHHRAVCLEKMMLRYFSSLNQEYSIPADIEKYLEHDDHYLQKILKSSSNPWAKRIVKNSVPAKIFETFGQSESEKVQDIQNLLSAQKIDFILCESTGRLTKYSHETNPYAIKVVKKYSGEIIDIHQATNLFQRYSHSHAVTRIHCDLETIPKDVMQKLHEITNTP